MRRFRAPRPAVRARLSGRVERRRRVRTQAQRPPSPLTLPDGADREGWQQPDRVMDSLGIFDGAHVADVMAGAGWFSMRLARRVGPTGSSTPKTPTRR